MIKLIYSILAISIIFSSCSEKRDKLTVLKDEMIGKDIKKIYGEKKILGVPDGDFDIYHVYFVNEDYTVKCNKYTGSIIDVCLGKKCFPIQDENAIPTMLNSQFILDNE